jgi:hypothetical protein
MRTSVWLTQQPSSALDFTLIEGWTDFSYLWCVLAHCAAENFNSLPVFQTKTIFLCLHRVCQGEYAIHQENVCCVKLLWYNPKYLYPKLNCYTNKFLKNKSFLHIYLFIDYQVLMKTPVHNAWLTFESHKDMRWDSLLLVSQKSSLGSNYFTSFSWPEYGLAWLLVKESPAQCMGNTC